MANTPRAGRGADATATGVSQAQSASAEPEHARTHQPEDLVEAASPEGVGVAAPIQHFDCTVVKIDADGNEVMSDHLAPGEQLRRATTTEQANQAVGEREQASTEQTDKATQQQ